MREYKFRGKAKATGEWVYGDLIHRYDNWTYIAPIPSVTNIKPIEVDPETVGQYTGLPDKNSKESYEHDIVKIYMYNGLYGLYPDEWIAEIVFEKGQFGIRYGDLYKEFYPLAAFFKSIKKEYIPNVGVGEVTIESEPMFEVIGNPWDNPELLKEVE